MRRMLAAILFAVVAVAGFATAPASAAEREPGPPGCFTERYALLFGQGIAVYCGYPGDDHGYRAVARCSTGGSFWYAMGNYAPYGLGPSVAECYGGLLNTAYVTGYQVIDG